MARATLSEVFVVLDDLFYRKDYYQNRTKLIGLNGNSLWITLPVMGGIHTPINQIKLASNCDLFMKKAVRTVNYNYSKCPYFNSVWKPVEEFLLDIGARENCSLSLSEVNIESIRIICSLLGMEPPAICLSSTLGVRNLERTERVLEICRLTEKRIFLTGWGAGVDPKVHNLQLFANNCIDVRPLGRDIWMDIEPDFVANEGFSTLHWIFIKGPTYVRERIRQCENFLLEGRNH